MATDSMMETARRIADKAYADHGILRGSWTHEAIKQAALAAIKEERERCAKVADRWADTDFDESSTCMAHNIADEIRRGQP